MSSYPVLFSTARLVRYQDICWLLEPQESFDRALYPAEALFLSLCDGHWTLEEVFQLCMRTYSISEKEAKDIFQAFASILTLSERRSAAAPRYDPLDFFCLAPDSTVSTEHFDAPIEMCLSLTHACNFRCIYCFNGSEKKAKKELSVKQWISVIDQAHELGVVKAIITGGEPMLHPGFFPILERVVQYGMVPMVCTNGSFITPEVTQRFQKLGIPFVQLSMDTSEKNSFEKLTGRNGSYEAVIQAIRYLTEAGIHVMVKAVVMRENLRELPDLVRLLDELGVSKLTLDRFDLGSSGRGDAGMLVGDADIEELQRQVRAVPRPQGLSVAVIQAKKHWGKPEDIIPCGAFRRSFIVLPNGDVTACEKMIDPSGLIVGNLAEESLREIWNGRRVREFFEIPAEGLDSACRECPHLKTCGTGCFACKQALGWPLHAMDPRCFNAPQESNPYAAL